MNVLINLFEVVLIIYIVETVEIFFEISILFHIDNVN